MVGQPYLLTIDLCITLYPCNGSLATQKNLRNPRWILLNVEGIVLNNSMHVCMIVKRYKSDSQYSRAHSHRIVWNDRLFRSAGRCFRFDRVSPGSLRISGQMQ